MKIRHNKSTSNDIINIMFVLSDKDEQRGTSSIVIYRNENIAEIIDLRIDTPDRRKRYGTKLYYYIENYLKKHNVEKVVLLERFYEDEKNQTNDFWNKLGFLETEFTDIGESGEYNRVKSI